MKTKILLLTLAMIACADFTATVIATKSNGTLLVDIKGEARDICIANIDTTILIGDSVQTFLDSILGKEVTLNILDFTGSKFICTVKIGEMDIASNLILRGYTRYTNRYPNELLFEIEKIARKSGHGLWRGKRDSSQTGKKVLNELSVQDPYHKWEKRKGL